MYKTRRLNSESADLMRKYDVKQFSDKEVVISINRIGDVQIKIPDDYPFKKPAVFVNRKKYKSMLRSPSPRFDQLLKKLYTICCLECESVTCDYNWHVGITIDGIIQEIEKNCNIKEKLAHYFLIESIKIKNHVPAEVDFFQYL